MIIINNDVCSKGRTKYWPNSGLQIPIIVAQNLENAQRQFDVPYIRRLVVRPNGDSWHTRCLLNLI